MALKDRPSVKSLFAFSPLIDDFQFISSGASDTITVHAIDKFGNVVGVHVLTIGTTAKSASQALAGASNIASHNHWVITAISGTVYALTGNAVTVTASNGWELAVDDRLGPAPGTGTIIQSLEPPESISISGTLDTELPAAAALNGTWAKTTVAPIVGAAPLLNDGTNLVQAVGGAGAVSSAVQRVTHASDDPAVTHLATIAGDTTDIETAIEALNTASTPYFLVCDGTDELLVSASARRLMDADIFSLNDVPCYLKIYDKATAADENDTPIKVVAAPSASTATFGGGNNKLFPVGGISLTNGLSIRVVKGLANNSDTAVDAAEVIAQCSYKTA